MSRTWDIPNGDIPKWGYPYITKNGISLNGDIPILFALWDILIFVYRISPCLANIGTSPFLYRISPLVDLPDE